MKSAYSGPSFSVQKIAAGRSGKRIRMTSTVSANMDSFSLGLSILGASSPTCFDWQVTHPIDVQNPYNRPTVSFAKFGSTLTEGCTPLVWGGAITQLVYAAMESKLELSLP